MVKRLNKNQTNQIAKKSIATAAALLLLVSIATTTACKQEEKLPKSTQAPRPTATTLPHHPDSVGELSKRLSEKSTGVQVPATKTKTNAKASSVNDNTAKPQPASEPPDNPPQVNNPYMYIVMTVTALLSVTAIAAVIYLIVQHKRKDSGPAKDEQRSG